MMTLAQAADSARKALETSDLTALEEADTVFLHHFFQRARRGDGRALDEFQAALFRVAGSPTARQLDESEPIPALLSRWRTFSELAAAVRKDVPARELAARFVERQKHGRRLLQLLAREGAEGLVQKELAERLDISPANISQILGEYERYQLVERHREGRNTFVSLGAVGQQLLQNEMVPRVPEPELLQLFQGRKPMINPRKALSVA